MTTKALAGLITVLLLAALAPLPTAEARTQNEPSVREIPLYLVLDISGSMNDGEPRTKLENAKTALYQIISELPGDQPVTLLTYPTGNKTIEGCNAGATRGRVDGGSRSQLAASIRGLSANGGTPTGPALLHVKEVFQASPAKAGVVILVSDGEANCGITPVCEVAQDLHDAGLELTVHTVRLEVGAEGAQQLQCISRATGGISVGVDDANQLVDIVQAATQQVSVDVTAPSALSTVTGTTSQAAGNSLRVRVETVGALPVRNVRVALRLTDGAGVVGSVYVKSPIRFLGNLQPGDSREVVFDPRPHTGVRGPITYEVVVSSEGAPTVVESGSVDIIDAADRSTAGPIFTQAKHVVIMGDSYSSGEGAGDYQIDDEGYAGQLWACHRSAHHYGAQVFASMPSTGDRKLSLVACSGAKIAEMYRYQYATSIRPQLTQLKRLIDEENPPDLIMLTLGGNDAGFGDLIISCIKHNRLAAVWPCGRDRNQPISAEKTAEIVTDLQQALVDINSLVNRQEIIDRRDGRVARIVVLPYPNPLPPSERLRSGCFTGINDSEAHVAGRFLSILNSAVTEGTTRASNSDVPVSLAGPVVTAFQDGRTICDADPAVRVDGLIGKKSGELTIFDDGFRRVQELMHPSKEGHALMADSLVEWSRSVPSWQGKASTSSAPKVEVAIQATFRLFNDRVMGITPHEAGQDMPSQCVGYFSERNCDRIKRAHIGTATLYSEPHVLGVVDPTNPDKLFADLRWPQTVQPGEHTLVFEGTTEDGEPIEASTTVRIQPQGFAVWAGTSAVGMVLILTGSAWWWLASRRGSRTD